MISFIVLAENKQMVGTALTIFCLHGCTSIWSSSCDRKGSKTHFFRLIGVTLLCIMTTVYA
jgi:hypothetical protein